MSKNPEKCLFELSKCTFGIEEETRDEKRERYWKLLNFGKKS